MVFGTFDNLHPGHLDYFRQARKFGEELTVIVARDRNVLETKGHSARQNEKIRLREVRRTLEKIDGSGRAILGNLKNKWLVLKKYHPGIICLGYDQKVDLSQLKREIVKFRLFCRIKRLKPYQPEKYKSSLRKNIEKYAQR